MRIGLGLGIPKRRHSQGVSAGGPPSFPPAFLDADLVLDSRLGVELNESNVTDWRNQGQGGAAIDFDKAGAPFLVYDSADPVFNGEPSIEQLDDGGLVRNADFSQLNYLHDGSSFSMFFVVDITNDASIQTIFANSNVAGSHGTAFQVGAGGNLNFRVFSGTDTVVNLISGWADGTHVVDVVYDGADYTMFIDGTSVATGPPLSAHNPAARGGAYNVGANAGPANELNGKVGHGATWNRDLSLGERQAVEQYLAETFIP